LICTQAEHAIQDPTLVDIRLMRDFSGQRPVDVALSFGYERLGVLLDPSQPIELLSSHVGRGADCTSIMSFGLWLHAYYQAHSQPVAELQMLSGALRVRIKWLICSQSLHH